MSNEGIEEFVEEIMRYYYMGDYEKYNDEELREQYRKMLIEDKPIERIEK